MLLLAIETSNPSCPAPGVAVGAWDGAGPVRVLADEPVAPASRESDDLTPAVQRALRAAGVRAADLNRVGVSVGPGGYTSLRMASVTGQMLSEVAGAECVAIPSAMVAAEATDDAAPLTVALAGKRDAAYITVFEPGWRARAALVWGRLMTAADVVSLPGARLMADRHVPKPIAEALGARGWSIVEPVFGPRAALALAARLAPIAPERLVPEYGREPEAVTLWKSRTSPRG